jgi:hypothetical protein
MKNVMTTVLLIFIIGNIGAVDIESYQFIDYLRGITVPGKPEIYEDAVIFTASSSHQRVGISFAHEGYARVHWFKRMMIPRDPADFLAAGKNAKYLDPNIDSGIMFHLEIIPANLGNMDYRLVFDGLWMADPLNPLAVSGPSGVVESRVPLPAAPKTPDPAGVPPGHYRFNFRAPPGETITVGGSFNNWDPFMYELREASPGFYTLTLPLPPGSFQYVFFNRGERIPDPANARKMYTRDGRIVSEAQLF